MAERSLVSFFKGKTIILTSVKKKKRKIVKFAVITGQPNHKKPVAEGFIEFYETESGYFRPFKIWQQLGNKEEYFDVREVRKGLKAAKIIYIIKNYEPTFLNSLLSFFRDFSISNYRIEEFCELCLVDNIFTLLTKTQAVKAFNRYVCLDCGVSEVLHELYSYGIQLSPSMKPHLKRILSVKKDVEILVDMMRGEYDPATDYRYTLYDTIDVSLEKIPSISIESLKLPNSFVRILHQEGINTLTPVQTLAIKNGLLENKNLLIVSSTTSGKTLIGELAGIPKALEKKSFIYLAPLVALANQKYEDFKRKYSSLGLKVSIRVGMSRLDVGDEEFIVVDTDIKSADILCATYEAFDYILRTGQANKVENAGTIVIDEIQMLNDEERGIELDGLIARIKMTFPDVQLLYLSATVGNPKELSRKLNAELVYYDGRPVPLERHIIFTKDDDNKLRVLRRLIIGEYNQVSSFGYHGQSIVFTYSRKRASEIAASLNSRGLRVASYHAGLTFSKRKQIELGFERGIYHAVITTAALGAGVDFPASQVIFFDLAMGNDWISTTEFNQFLGRAGRLGKHNRGKVVLLVTPGNKLHMSQENTEDEIAVKLLTGKIEEVNISSDFESGEEQLLAFITLRRKLTIEELRQYVKETLSLSSNIDSYLSALQKRGMIKVLNGEFVIATKLGTATSASFFKPKLVADTIKPFLLRNNPNLLDLAVRITPFDAVYLSNRLYEFLRRTFRSHISTKFFNGPALDIMSQKERKTDIPKWVLATLIKWNDTFFTCGCKESPYCEHGPIELSKYLLNLRMNGFMPVAISSVMSKEYQLHIYPGDLFNWLDSVVHTLEGIARIAHVLNKERLAKIAIDLKNKIEHPSRRRRRGDLQKM